MRPRRRRRGDWGHRLQPVLDDEFGFACDSSCSSDSFSSQDLAPARPFHLQLPPPSPRDVSLSEYASAELPDLALLLRHFMLPPGPPVAPGLRPYAPYRRLSPRPDPSARGVPVATAMGTYTSSYPASIMSPRPPRPLSSPRAKAPASPKPPLFPESLPPPPPRRHSSPLSEMPLLRYRRHPPQEALPRRAPPASATSSASLPCLSGLGHGTVVRQSLRSPSPHSRLAYMRDLPPRRDPECLQRSMLLERLYFLYQNLMQPAESFDADSG